jgi:hypothetical protein
VRWQAVAAASLRATGASPPPTLDHSPHHCSSACHCLLAQALECSVLLELRLGRRSPAGYFPQSPHHCSCACHSSSLRLPALAACHRRDKRNDYPGRRLHSSPRAHFTAAVQTQTASAHRTGSAVCTSAVSCPDADSDGVSSAATRSPETTVTHLTRDYALRCNPCMQCNPLPCILDIAA